MDIIRSAISKTSPHAIKKVPSKRRKLIVIDNFVDEVKWVDKFDLNNKKLDIICSETPKNSLHVLKKVPSKKRKLIEIGDFSDEVKWVDKFDQRNLWFLLEFFETWKIVSLSFNLLFHWSFEEKIERFDLIL